MIAWLTAVALAADPVCGQNEFAEAPKSQSVAWVSPSGRTVGRRGEVTLVPTADLRAWIKAQGNTSVTRLLQALGLRGNNRPPKRPWKVVIFDAERTDLCRPIGSYEDPIAISGLITCKASVGKPTRGQTGCGTTLDRATGNPSFEQFRGSWEDLARNGFCVLPAERFIASVTGAEG